MCIRVYVCSRGEEETKLRDVDLLARMAQLSSSSTLKRLSSKAWAKNENRKLCTHKLEWVCLCEKSKWEWVSATASPIASHSLSVPLSKCNGTDGKSVFSFRQSPHRTTSDTNDRTHLCYTLVYGFSKGASPQACQSFSKAHKFRFLQWVTILVLVSIYMFSYAFLEKNVLKCQ